MKSPEGEGLVLSKLPSTINQQEVGKIGESYFQVTSIKITEWRKMFSESPKGRIRIKKHTSSSFFPMCVYQYPKQYLSCVSFDLGNCFSARGRLKPTLAPKSILGGFKRF